MWQLTVFILRFLLSICWIFFANYVLLIALRDILFFILPIGPPTFDRLKSIQASDIFTWRIIPKILFWVFALGIIGFMMPLVPPFIPLILLAYAIFRAGEKMALSPSLLTFLLSVLIAWVTGAYVKSQPILMQIGDRFSVDLVIYNTCNSLIDMLVATAMKFNIDPSGIVRLAKFVPYVQENLLHILIVSIFIFTAIFFGRIAKIIVPYTKLKSPPYYEIAPLNIFPLIALCAFAIEHFFGIRGLVFIVGGIYYAWGVNLLIYLLRGGHWALNLFILAAGIMHPALIVIFIAAGAVDNIVDVRRLLSVLGFKKAAGEIS